MAEDRMIRASMRTSEKVNSWPIPLRYFWTQLWGYCDSYGRARRDARLVFAGTFPMDEEVDAKVVERWMHALETAGVIESYEVGGKQYFECLNWDEHQPMKYRKKTDIPDRSGIVPGSGESSEKFPKSSHHIDRDRDKEVDRDRESVTTLTPFCKKHPTGTDSPCRACGNARRAFDAAVTVEKHKATVPGIITPDYATECTGRHKWTADGTCAVCPARREAVAS